MGCSGSKPDVVAPPPSVGEKAPMGGGNVDRGGAAATKTKSADGPNKSRIPDTSKSKVSPKDGPAGSEASTASSRSAAAKKGEGGNNNGSSDGGHVTGYSSGASTPGDDSSLDGSTHKKSLRHSNSILGLDKMIEDRKDEGVLKSQMVHIEVPFGKPIEEVYDGVHDGPVLGSGISGLVRLIAHKKTGVKYAVKCLDLGLVETEEGLQQLREEIYIMCQLDHPNIVRLEEVYESLSEIYLVQELCVGGELFDRLDEQPDYHYTEAQCARLVKQMLNSVRYIHSKGIIHRDLKLENFLFSSTEANSELKMIDFGLSKHFKFGEVQHEAVGTPYTVAPEVIRGCYDERCDVWAIGVITFLLLSGDPPFGGCGGPEPLMTVRENILRGQFEFEPEDVWENVSPQAIEFIKKLLVTDPNHRPTARETQRSSWLKEWANKSRNIEDNILNPNVVKALVNFKEYSDMRKLLCEVLSFTLLPDQIADLRREFEKLDTDGSGEISLSGLKQVLISNAGTGSLGALTEEEVEDIFNAMRVRKTETRIHWHEFIAAGLSQCKVDDRNLKLAFDRLDADHKGYITFENVTDLLGNDPSHSEDAMRRMWGDSMKACNCMRARITYDDFLLLMKGQTKPDLDGLGASQSSLGSSSFALGRASAVGMSLGVVHESLETAVSGGSSTDAGADSNLTVLLSGDVVAADGSIKVAAANQGLPPPPPPPGQEHTSPHVIFSQSAPTLGDGDDMSDGPLLMEDDDLDEKISEAADKMIADLGGSTNTANLTPPQSPKRGAVDFITPVSQRDKLSPKSLDSAPVLPSSIPSPFDAERSALLRRRSRSVDDQDTEGIPPLPLETGEQSPVFRPDVRRATFLPEHNHNSLDIEKAIKDETKTPLVVNRKLYRAHRQMRLAVLEASKRFEEQQIARTKKILDEQNKTKPCGAGLTMRHGLVREMSSGSIRKLMQQQQTQQDTAVSKANKRGGRGRRTRKKTVSDMAGMLSSAPPAAILMDPTPSQSTDAKNESDLAAPPPPPSSTTLQRGETDSTMIFRPTTPGVFRKTVDPFAEFSGYRKMAGLESTSGVRSVMPLSGQTFAQGAVSASLKQTGQVSSKSSAPSSGFAKKGSDLRDASVHSMKSSASDGQLDHMDPDSSPQSTSDNSTPSSLANDTPAKVTADSSWPPPPPL
eukprot:CAMPEP_0113570380 /NCGR_PEP_ID=MMETSP0015_2-20120614/24932_1 /TAXON_ID=2838 /ORGANISM="Odontella" /LENGTH=1169 /DNA_ID=CAMNT_0000473145 /DNA_START=72 /DNA_END=3581 /DNA_ORIENTATION=- /assembly_acc=CAM_ASM_000160